jgi:F-type H+-transporting ATPase subunit b
MELLKTLGIDWRLLFWQIVNFLIVLFVLKRYAFGPIVEALAKRTEKLEQGLKDAASAKESLLSADKEKAAMIASARGEAGRILTETRTEAEAMRAETLAKAKSEVEEIVVRGRRVASEKEAMVEAARSELGSIVVDAVARILPRVLTDKDKEKLVEEAAAALKGKI